jgi:hypothetical protein
VLTHRGKEVHWICLHIPPSSNCGWSKSYSPNGTWIHSPAGVDGRRAQDTGDRDFCMSDTHTHSAGFSQSETWKSSTLPLLAVHETSHSLFYYLLIYCCEVWHLFSSWTTVEGFQVLEIERGTFLFFRGVDIGYLRAEAPTLELDVLALLWCPVEEYCSF